MLPSQELETH